jgi:hypothetical protein
VRERLCSTVAAVAPVSAATVANEAGPRELAIATVSERREVPREGAADVTRTDDPDVHVYFHFCGANQLTP